MNAFSNTANSQSKNERNKTMQMQKINDLLRDTKGANIVEYIILVAIMAILAIAVFTTLSGKVKTRVEAQGNAIDGMPEK